MNSQCTWEVCEYQEFRLLEKEFMNLGVHAGSEFKLNQAGIPSLWEWKPGGESTSILTGEGRVLVLPEFTPGGLPGCPYLPPSGTDPSRDSQPRVPRPSSLGIPRCSTFWVWTFRICSAFWVCVSFWTVEKQAAYLSWFQDCCFFSLDSFFLWILQPFDSSFH